MKTVSVALVYCMNIGVDPPDVVKTDPCARLECWIDPISCSPQKALENIGKALQAQYERCQPRSRYKLILDPTIEEVKKLCLSLRRNAKDERVLFHYNGHGVPKPTTNGEIWVFNKNYTQYIPLSIYELQTWMGSPSIFVFDCSASGLIIHWFLKFAQQREQEYEKALNNSGPVATSPAVVLPVRDYFLLAACGMNETLPMNPQLPADVFTSCLTTPIKIAVIWFCLNSQLSKYPLEIADQLPGRLPDRRTPLGELNWVFTAVTDTIAWNVLPRDLFQKLFRQDLLVANLFRNFLLAERILRSLNCNPQSYPVMPPTYHHPMWEAWDLAVDSCLAELPGILADPSIEYQGCSFFSDQLTAFEVWLEFGNENKKSPEQLPIVLQVLLSQAHRLRALKLLSKFLDLGSWAVNLALSVGIFPYVLKLLQSPAGDLRQVLIFIWTKILALDKSCQLDLVKDNGHNYFISVLSTPNVPSDQRAMSAFVLSIIANNCRPGQSACLSGNLLSICLSQMTDPDPLVRRWLILCVAKLWESFEEAKLFALRENAHEKLNAMLTDPVPEVRAASVYAFGTFIGGSGEENEQRIQIEINMGLVLMTVMEDISPLVRKELIITLSKLVRTYEKQFKEVATDMLEEEKIKEAQRNKKKTKKKVKTDSQDNTPEIQTTELDSKTHGTVFGVLWETIVSLRDDPFPDLAKLASNVIQSIEGLVQSANSTPSLTNSNSLRAPKSPARPRTGAFGQFGSGKSSTSLNSPLLRRANSIQDFSKEQENPENIISPEDFQSVFFEWSCEYFSKPLLESNEEMDSIEKWKLQKRKSIIESSMKIDVQSISRLDEPMAIIDNSPGSVSSLLFHPFDSTLVISDEKDGISVWDREQTQQLNTFKNRSIRDPPGNSTLTGMCFLNEDSKSLLLTGSDDGIIRVWSNYDQMDQVKLVSSWRALPTSNLRGPVVTKWQPRYCQLLTAGNVDVIRVWDLERELLFQDIPTGSEKCITSLSSEPSENRTTVAGCGDGAVRIYDFRNPPKYSALHSYNEHKEWIINVHIPKSNKNAIVSASTSGEIKIWDIRNTGTSVRTFVAFPTGLNTVSAHDFSQVIACGSQKQQIKIFNFEGKELSHIKYHDGFLGQRIGPVTCSAFHPYLVLLAIGASDSIVSLYTKRQV